ncbi:hypothetical protein SUDANB120_03972 [Streptomyces sp. enrichment culture]
MRVHPGGIPEAERKRVRRIHGTQPWHAPVRFGPSVFPPGAPIAMANQAPDLLTALGVDKQGFLNVAWVVGTQPWHTPVRFGPAVFPASP